MVQKKIQLLKEKSKPVINFFSQQKVQNIILIILFLSLIIWTSSIRLSNVPLLKDSTTGEYIPLALDPFYFLRLAETINLEGHLPESDLMRYPSLKVGFSQEILPQAIVFLYKLANTFGEYSLQQIDVLSPVVFYVLGMILFFLLIWSLTSNKWVAFLSSGFLAVIPPYLHRTMAGFSDHEAIGMMSFFLALLILSLSLKYLEKLRKINWKLILLSLLLAFSTIFSLLSWGGIAKFLFMIIPLSFLLIWLIESKNKGSKSLLSYLIFYLIWVIFTLIFGEFFGYSSITLIKGYLLSTSGILTLFLAIFFPINYFFEKYFLKKVNKTPQKYPLDRKSVV